MSVRPDSIVVAASVPLATVVVGWFVPSKRELFRQERLPAFNIDGEAGEFYGTPEFSIPGFKFGRVPDDLQEVDPATRRDPTRAEKRRLREEASRYLAYEDGPTMRLDACLVTHSPDDHFVVDAVPDEPNVVVGAGFSGHGFKFCPVIGEILADLVETGDSDHDTSKFRLDRRH